MNRARDIIQLEHRPGRHGLLEASLIFVFLALALSRIFAEDLAEGMFSSCGRRAVFILSMMGIDYYDKPNAADLAVVQLSCVRRTDPVHDRNLWGPNCCSWLE